MKEESVPNATCSNNGLNQDVEELLVVQPCMPDITGRSIVVFISGLVSLGLAVAAILFVTPGVWQLGAFGFACLSGLALGRFLLTKVGPAAPLVFTNRGLRGPGGMSMTWQDIDSYCWGVPAYGVIGQTRSPDRNIQLIISTNDLSEYIATNKKLQLCGIVFSVEEQRIAREIFRSKGIPEL